MCCNSVANRSVVWIPFPDQRLKTLIQHPYIPSCCMSIAALLVESTQSGVLLEDIARLKWHIFAGQTKQPPCYALWYVQHNLGHSFLYQLEGLASIQMIVLCKGQHPPEAPSSTMFSSELFNVQFLTGFLLFWIS
jgi:hypothetical protein